MSVTDACFVPLHSQKQPVTFLILNTRTTLGFDIATAHTDDIRMCYQIWTHTLRCANQPLLPHGEKEAVNTYAEPTACSCEQERIKPWFRCKYHGCCLVTAKIWRCGHPYCAKTWEAHLYRPSRQADSTLWRHYPVLDAWFLSRTFWGDTHQIPRESPQLIYSLSRVVKSAEEVHRAMQRVAKGHSGYNQLNGQWNCCEECTRSHDPFNCGKMRNRYLQKQFIVILAEQWRRRRTELASDIGVFETFAKWWRQGDVECFAKDRDLGAAK